MGKQNGCLEISNNKKIGAKFCFEIFIDINDKHDK
jgi:hypothetical protein